VVIVQLNTCDAPAASDTDAGVGLQAALSVVTWTFVSGTLPSFVSVQLKVTWSPTTAISGLAVLGEADMVVDGAQIGKSPSTKSFS
jgi:hypothetical protein